MEREEKSRIILMASSKMIISDTSTGIGFLLAVITVTTLLFCPCPAVAQKSSTPEPKGSPRITFNVKPEKLTLGEFSSAQFVIRAEKADGVPLQGADMRVHVNVGKLTYVKSTGPGEITAVYVPPKKFFPQFAILTAVAKSKDTTVRGWTVLPLWGQGDAEVISRPRASVKVRIGKDTFGPVKADRYGRANIPVIVPPGIRNAKAGKRTIDLKVPAFNRITAIADDAILTADGRHKTAIWIYAITNLGKPEPRVLLRIQADRGTLSEPTLVEKGVYQVEYTPPVQVGDGRTKALVSLKGDPASVYQVEFQIVAGTPDNMSIRAEPATFTAGQKDPVRVQLELSDRKGNPTTVKPALQVDIGTAGPVKSIKPGHFQAIVNFPDFFGTRSQAQIEASVPTIEAKVLRAKTTVELQPAAARRISFQDETDSLLADGKTGKKILLDVTDDYGNPVQGVELETSASVGTVSKAGGRDDRKYQVEYMPPMLRQPSSAVVRVSGMGLEAEKKLELVEQYYWFSIAPRVGFQTNFGHLNSPYFSAELSIHLPFIFRGFVVGFESGYYYSNRADSESGISSSLAVVPFNGLLGYKFKVHDRVSLNITAGVGAYLANNSLSMEGQPKIKRQTFALGYHVSLEAGFLLGPGHISLQVRYAFVDAYGVEDLSGNIGGLVALAGYQFGLF
jgi:hypothetical protein